MSQGTRNVTYDSAFAQSHPAAAAPADFVSFPTLPDPEVVASRSISTIISKTLRKVTNNASNLVHTYLAPGAGPSLPHTEYPPQNDAETTPIRPLESAAPNEAISAKEPRFPAAEGSGATAPIPAQSRATSRGSRREHGDRHVPLDLAVTGVPPQPPSSTPTAENAPPASDAAPEIPSGAAFDSASTLTAPGYAETGPKVTSDNLFLKLLSAHAAPVAVALLSTDGVLAENTKLSGGQGAHARTLAHSLALLPPQDTVSRPLPKVRDSIAVRESTVRTLQNRILSIFNNLPNDIELSDDESALDQDADDHDALLRASSLRLVSENSFVSLALARVSFVGARNSPRRPLVHARRVETPILGSSTTPRKPRSPGRESNTTHPAAILDSARAMIPKTFGGQSLASLMASPAKSKQLRKNLKKRRRLASNNPLKNGGIPRKYWMHDAFVADCLNCFKPFLAFRRKHHCRFCGQIFCSQCTIFVSYSQYKQQRHAPTHHTAAHAFKDKLRVCTPCYSDVVVYLSDDSLGSEDEKLESTEPDAPPLERVSLRLRSFSASSTKSGVVVPSPALRTRRDQVGLPIESPLLVAGPSPATEKSPEGIFHRHPPQMAIPTRRTGEALEIAIPAGSYTQSGSLNAHQTLRSLGHGGPGGSGTHTDKIWFKNYPRRLASVSSEIGNLKSIDNISSFYMSVVNGKYVRRPQKLKLEFSKRILAQPPDEDAVPEVEAESENEDEKAMSLYTSLNHLAAGESMPPRPRNHLAASMPGVPTLLEFQGIEGKYAPANVHQSDAMTRFEFKPIDSFSNASVTENRQRSNFRSNERAKASLRRIKDRRNQKLVRKSHSGISMVPSIEANFNSHPGTPPDPFISPGLSASKLGVYYPRSDESPSKVPPVMLMSPHKELRSNLSTLSLRSEDRKCINLQGCTSEQALLAQELVHLSDSNSIELISHPINHSLSAMFDERLKLMIKQCLEDCDIKDQTDQTRWVKVLLSTFANIHQIKINDTLDVKQYIKIKKILGGKPEDTTVMDGLFITKDVDSKRMQSLIEKPKIALLVFPLEYLKQKEQFISLRVVNSQQSVYISNLVSRLISLEPDIVIVGDTVCGLAERLLEEASITVISNVKPQVIERISRYTKADIFQSVNDLFFKKGSLGVCGQFEIKKFVFGQYVKTFAFFVGNEMQSGFTICLRGGDEEYLNSVKYASESLIPGAFNSRFEQSFFRDFSLVIDPPSNEDVLELVALEKMMHVNSNDPNDLRHTCIGSMEHYGVFSYVKLFSERILSFSPSVSYSLPKALDNVVKAFKTFVQYYDLDLVIQNLFEKDEVEKKWLELLHFDFKLEKFNGKKDIITYLKFVSNEWVHFYLREFNFRIRIWSNSMKYSIYQLYPIFHRSIHFLHSRISIKNATPCYGPVVVVVDYYSDNDKCLGAFLDQTLQETGRICDECGDLLLNHYKTYVHGNYKIDLVVEKIDDDQTLEHFKDKGRRIMWSYCPECHLPSATSAMSDETYYLSLGKFFELNFCSRHTAQNKQCEHDFFKSQIKYFGFNGYFIRFEISQITTYEVVVPRKKLEFLATLSLELKLDSLNVIQNSSRKFFQSILNRLNRIKVDTFDKAEAGSKKIEELKTRAKIEEDAIKSETMRIYESTMPTNYMSLNVVQREIQELGVSWDREFKEFENQFLPTENEITKITQFHLRNFLIDRLDTEMKENPENIENPGGKFFSKEMNVEKSSGQLSDLRPTAQNERKPSNDDLFSIGSRRVPLTIIEDKIMQIRQSLEDDQNKHVTKSPTKSRVEPEVDIHEPSGSQGPTRVQDLTNYFNQMTLEFQKQREAVLERQLSKYKAVPIVKSQPIVEIYDNIEDVVDVDQKMPAGSRTSPALQKNEESDGPNSKMQSSPTEADAHLDNDERIALAIDLARNLKETPKHKLDIPQPEKNSLLKSLSNFWADRSATLWDPLEYPLDFTEHTFADSEVIVREDEPSSLVAFCLSTNDYKQKLNGMDCNESVLSEDKGNDNLEISEQFRKKSEHFSKLERKFKKRLDQNQTETSELEAILNQTKSSHLKYQFVDGSTEMSCKIFYSEQFDALRKACGVDDSFIQSLSRCVKWNSTGGKSGSNFLKTLDNRYIVKELSKSELESFVSIAPFYFKYISQSTFNTLTTALAKIFGFYQVEFKNSLNGKIFKMDFLIMENLFYNRKTTRIFDLKGSMRNRHVKQTGEENEVLLDENMIEYIYESPVFVKEQLKKLLRGSLFNDTSFLSAMDVMDYSLVIGIDDPSGKLYVGIIDWLRTFTWDKKVENWVKGKSLVGKKGKDPTIVTPKQYRTRFREAMDRYILEVPDIWYEGSSQ